MISLDEWLEAMTTAENLVKVRKRGFVYLSAERIPIAASFAENVGVDFDDWLNRYFDYDHYS